MDKNELDTGNHNIVQVDKKNRSVTVTKPNSGQGEPPKTYYFDNVFGEESTQVRLIFFLCDDCRNRLFECVFIRLISVFIWGGILIY